MKLGSTNWQLLLFLYNLFYFTYILVAYNTITNLDEENWLRGCDIMLSGSYLANNWKAG